MDNINPDVFSVDSGTYYGDASGGEYSSYPEVRRVGCGFAFIDEEGELLFGAHFPLPGAVQTVPRGGLFTLVQLMRQALPMSEIVYVIDNKGVFDNFNKGPKHACRCTNADLYHELFLLTIKKAIRLTLKWMPSHLDTDDRAKQRSTAMAEGSH